MKSLKQIGIEIGDLVEKKNSAYGSAFEKAGEVLKIMYPDGIRPEQYSDMLATVRILDKLFRIANNKKAFSEEPWKDIAGYGILGVHKEQSILEEESAGANSELEEAKRISKKK